LGFNYTGGYSEVWLTVNLTSQLCIIFHNNTQNIDMVLNYEVRAKWCCIIFHNNTQNIDMVLNYEVRATLCCIIFENYAQNIDMMRISLPRPHHP
jgi:hypothetical protein